MQRVPLAVLLAVFAASPAGAGMQTPTRIERTSTVLNLPFSGSVKAGGLIYVSGTLATDANGRIVAGDIKAQTKQTLENITAELARHGTTLDRCAAVMVYLKRRSDFAAMNEVYATFFPNDPPTRTTIVADLLRLDANAPEALVEISAIALPPGAPREVVLPAGWTKSPNPYSYAIRSGDLLFLSGLVPRNARDGATVEGGIGPQTTFVLQQAGELLAAAGMSHADVVSSRVFVTDAGAFQDMNAAYRPFFTGDKPARATVVTDLMNPAFKVEITMLAVKGARQVFTTPQPDGSPGRPSQNYSSAIRVGHRLFLAGVTGESDATRGDVGAQTRAALAEIDRALKHAGFSRAEVVDGVVYLTDLSGYRAMNEAWREMFGPDLPARATVRTDLVVPDGLVEIMVVAVKP